MTMKTEDLMASSLNVVDLCRQAEGWLADPTNTDLVGRERNVLIRSTRRLTIKAKRLAAAVNRPMSVAVFGPSQVGKSYLVSVIARPELGDLKARFDGMEPLDFLTEINPAGEKESTGLVTRFTTRKGLASPAGFPVQLALLSEMDVIKVLGNTYFNDGDQTKEEVPQAEELASIVDSLKQRRTSQHGLSEDDIVDLQDYFQKHFVGNRLIEILANYWKDMVELAPSLSLADRAELFGFLWGRHAKFTWLFKELVSAIELLGRSSVAFATIDSLRPREKSIIDVSTLAMLGRDGDSKITLKSESGKEISVNRALAAALTAELRIEMAERPRPMFEHTDLLDFPGARSRQKFALNQQLNEKDLGLRDCFLRGKVAYLFDRYVAEQELTAMLLCVRPSANEVVTLPDMIDEWITDTHGRRPDARMGKPNCLFFVLTWFDTHFVDKAGDLSSPSGRFSARLDASLLGFFGKAHNWPREWTPGEPFDNCYWFRNPNYPATAIINYEGKREVEVRPESVARIEELKQGFLSLEEAAHHFRDPKRAFEEGLRLNDGGASYIVEALEPVCRPELKLQQIQSRLHDIAESLASLLRRFFVSLDVEGRLTERRDAADRVFDELENAISRGTFATLLRSLMIDPTDLSEEIYSGLRSNFGGEAQSTGAAIPAPVRPGRRSGAAASPPSSGGVRSLELNLAHRALEAFISHMRAAAEADVISRTTHVDHLQLKEMVDEIVALMGRVRLQEEIADKIRSHLGSGKPEFDNATRIALVASTTINRMLGDFGLSRTANPASRPDVETSKGTRPAFEVRETVFDATGLTNEPKMFAHDFTSDWFASFYKVVEDNATTLSGIQVDVEQNIRLKEILDGLGHSMTSGN